MTLCCSKPLTSRMTVFRENFIELMLFTNQERGTAMKQKPTMAKMRMSEALAAVDLLRATDPKRPFGDIHNLSLDSSRDVGIPRSQQKDRKSTPCTFQPCHGQDSNRSFLGLRAQVGARINTSAPRTLEFMPRLFFDKPNSSEYARRKNRVWTL